MPTCGRPTLSRTLASIASQIEDGDEILVMCDKDALWGNRSRDRMMEKASGTHLMFLDDDDVYAEGALAIVREAIEANPDHVHIFRMESAGDNNPWNGQEVRPGNIGTPMVVWPNAGPFPLWTEDSTGQSDFHFIDTTIRRLGYVPIWHEEVLAIVRPA